MRHSGSEALTYGRSDAGPPRMMRTRSELAGIRMPGLSPPTIR